MTTQIAAGAGFRHVQVLPLSANLLPLVGATGATGDIGKQASGAKAFTLNVPDAQIISHTGDDRVSGMDMLPATEGATAEIRTGKTNLELDALLSNVEAFALGEMSAMLHQTNQQGCEIQACVLAYRAAQDADPSSASKGARRWIWVMLPSALIFPKPGAMEEGGKDETAYTVVPSVVTAWPWQIAFSDATEGATEGQFARGISEGPPMLESWEGDGIVVAFDLAETARAITAAKVFHWVALTGVASDVTAAVVITTADITFTVAPAADDIVTAFYEKTGC